MVEQLDLFDDTPLESSIEGYLVRQVKKLDGEVRKVTWPGRRHAPDRLVLLPPKKTPGGLRPRMAFVETKRPGEDPRPGQVREHKRLRAMGVRVETCDTRETVDSLIAELASS